jgi:GH24 family phage-related lysozyme (muramidase)
VLRLIQVPLDDGQFDALVSFTFNLGAGALQRSTLRRKVTREEHEKAPAEFRRWVWADGHKLAGLVRRRETEINRYVATDSNQASNEMSFFTAESIFDKFHGMVSDQCITRSV